MHKENEVAKLEMDHSKGIAAKILDVKHAEHLPVGLFLKNGNIDRSSFNEWWQDRRIPDGRPGLDEALKALGIPNAGILSIESYGLSLSDTYWIRLEESSLSWSQVNFYENAFSEAFGDLLFGMRAENKDAGLLSPDITCDGFLPKRWRKTDSNTCLYKAGSEPYFQQTLNEEIAFRLAKRLGIEHVPYFFAKESGQFFSVCENFTSPDIELVPAWRIIQTRKKRNNTSAFQHLLDCCESLSIPNVRESLDKMLVLDYLILNEDRHYNNFGFLRNPDTLKWLGPAPIYDSGTSLGYDKTAEEIRYGANLTCKPFRKRHEEQILLVENWDWFDMDSLKGFDEEMSEVFEKSDGFISHERTEAIIYSVQTRIERLKFLSEADHTRSRAPFSGDNDIKNEKESYKRL